MRRRARVIDTTDYFGEFLEERAGLWPERVGKGSEAVDQFSEFGTEVGADADRRRHVARGRERQPPSVHNYRHMLAVASVMISLCTPAGVISTVIVGRELTVSPLEMWHALPPLPSRSWQASVDRLMGIPSIDLPSPPLRPADLNADASPRTPLRGQADPAPALPANLPAAPVGFLPLTSALLSAPIPAAHPLDGFPPPVRSNLAPAVVNAPAAPPPAPAVPAALPAASPAPSPAAESAAVRAALDRYREAFSSLDATSAKSVWPAVDEKALSRAFSQVSHQQFVFDACSVDVTGPRATASCQGRAHYVPKVGSRTTRVEPRHWSFTLRRAETQWTIESVDSR